MCLKMATYIEIYTYMYIVPADVALMLPVVCTASTKT